MKDPERIGRILELLDYIWTNLPESRLGQLLINSSGYLFEQNPFYFEDDNLEYDLISFKKRIYPFVEQDFSE